MGPLALVFDIGAHDGTDTAYFLARGCTVVAVDADNRMVEALTNRFDRAVKAGKLTIINRAVAGRSGDVLNFYISEQSWWSSAKQAVSDRRGSYATTVEVRTVTLADHRGARPPLLLQD
jgi:FkbM family methyltransferase